MAAARRNRAPSHLNRHTSYQTTTMTNETNFFSLRIKKPCTENWEAMTPVEKGRFCDSCQKTVVDFSSMSESDIIQFFQNYAGDKKQICGRLQAGQEKRLYASQPPALQVEKYAPKPLRHWAAAAALVLTSLSQPILAQNQLASTFAAPTAQTDCGNKSNAPLKSAEILPNTQGLSGTVAYKHDPAQKIAGAQMVLLLNGEVIASTSTQADGSYFLNLPARENIKGYNAKSQFTLAIQHPNTRAENFQITGKRLYSGKSMSFLLRNEVPYPKHDGGISFDEHRRMQGN